jgi:DNA repair protein RadC
VSLAEDRLLGGEAERLSEKQVLGALLRPWGAAEARRLAARLLDDFGGLYLLGRAAPQEWRRRVPLDGDRALALAAGFELGRRSRHPRLASRPRLLDPRTVWRLTAPEMEGLSQEQFRALLLDSQHRLIRSCLVAQGGLNAAVVQPREFLRPAILAAAQAVVLVHNHPSGDPDPSEDDIRLTLRFGEACRLVGIELLDHIVLGADGYRSLREEGVFP